MKWVSLAGKPGLSRLTPVCCAPPGEHPNPGRISIVITLSFLVATSLLILGLLCRRNELIREG